MRILDIEFGKFDFFVTKFGNLLLIIDQILRNIRYILIQMIFKI